MKLRMKLVLAAVALVLLVLAASSGLAVSAQTSVADMMAKSGLDYDRVNNRTDMWYITFDDLDNLDEIDVYVWARKTPYVSIYATVYTLEEDPSRSFLWRLLELNNEMLPYKYVIWEDEDESGTYYVDCQVDLPLKGLTADDIRTYVEGVVNTLDENYDELYDLI